MSEVLVLNAGGTEVLQRVSLKHAIGMLYRQVARVREQVPGETFGPYPLPKSIELVKYIYTRWVWEATGRMPCTRENVLRRDCHRCAYCGRSATTVDHVLPRSRGGKNSWTNCVAACYTCNQRKANRTPTEAGMPLKITPRQPNSIAELWPRRM
ncbi:MAG: HNH endonuclease [Propionibacteriaceae bacterium]|jgi:5-methylcytosine-specific restriction endonuclease McrA|nr:HNH endonuclease [Propionibacteriaceae bacterium]